MDPFYQQKRVVLIILAVILALIFSPRLHAEKPKDWKEPSNIRAILEANDNALPAGLSHIMAYKESRFNPLAVSPNGQDRGLMQLNKRYQADVVWRHTSLKASTFQWSSAEHSAIAGCNYLAYLIDRFGGSVYLGLIAYNWGEGNLSRIKNIDEIPKKVTNYADSALKMLDEWDETW